MQLISTELGKVVQLFVPDEIRPLSGLNIPDFIRLIQERYGFAKVPELKEVAHQARRLAGSPRWSRVKVMLQVVRTVRPPLEGFYQLLSDEQKAHRTAHR
jgi:hypothetical protein